jgi:hypothetical protein
MADQKHHVQAQPTGARKMAPKKGIGSYPAGEPGSGPSGGETGGKDDVNLDERMGSNKPRKDGKGDLASDPGRIQRDLDLYQDEMVQDSPASGSPDDNP